MVVAMIAMLMVQPAIDQVVDVISVRHSLMAAPRPMDVSKLMALAAVFRCAADWIFLVDLDDVRLAVAAARMVKLAVMQIINMVAMHHGDVAATRAVFVSML
jgi:hypothetical protein